MYKAYFLKINNSKQAYQNKRAAVKGLPYQQFFRFTCTACP